MSMVQPALVTQCWPSGAKKSFSVENEGQVVRPPLWIVGIDHVEIELG